MKEMVSLKLLVLQNIPLYNPGKCSRYTSLNSIKQRISEMARILIIEDDKKLNDGIRLPLLNEKYEITQSRTLEQARAVMKAVTLDLIVLDLNLPDGNGLDFLTKLRQAS